jgi:hypothetical protein
MHYFSENLVAPGIKSGPKNLWPGTLTIRPQRRSNMLQLRRKTEQADGQASSFEEMSSAY